jgi:hypothetical protein
MAPTDLAAGKWDLTRSHKRAPPNADTASSTNETPETVRRPVLVITTHISVHPGVVLFPRRYSPAPRSKG